MEGWAGAGMAGACAGAVTRDCCCGMAVVVDGFRVRFEAGEALRSPVRRAVSSQRLDKSESSEYIDLRVKSST